MGGGEYIKTQRVPWTAWLTLYKKSFLIKNNIHYADHVLFEDSDYVLKCILLAKTVKYEPLAVLKHMKSGNSTVNIGNSRNKIEDRLKNADRLYDVFYKYKDAHPQGAEVIKGHYKFMYRAIMMRNLWRVDYKSILSLLKRYPYLEAKCDDKLIALTMNHPKIYACMAVVFSPMLKCIIKVRNRFK